MALTSKIAVPVVAALALVGVLGTGTALAAGAWALETRAADRLDAGMDEHVRQLLPGGSVESVEVTDSPALLAGRREHVQQTVARGRTADDLPVLVLVREFDSGTGRAESVSWQLEGLPLAPGWAPVRGDAGEYRNEAERELDGHRVTVTAVVEVVGSTVTARPGRVTVDGADVPLEQAPAAVRESLAAVTAAVPLPEAGGAVGSVWFAEDGLGVELRAADVDAGEG